MVSPSDSSAILGLPPVLINYVFIKSHSLSSICDRKITGDEGPRGDELELRQVPEGWK